MNLAVPTFLIASVLSLFPSRLIATPEESKYILLPPEYTDCSLSPNGRYVAIHRSVLSSPSRYSKPKGPSLYSTKVYIQDLSTNKLVLAGPPDEKGKNTDPRDWVDQAKWAADGSLLILTEREVMAVDPATGSPTQRYNIHATLRKERDLPLPDSLEKPLLYYDINWSRGASVALYSFLPKTGKALRLTESCLVKYLAVSVTKPNGNQALSLRAFTKGTDKGYTWELDQTGELQVYPTELDPEWERATTSSSACKEGEQLMQRYLETGEAAAELRLFDYRANQFIGASALVPRQYVDLASSLLTKTSIDKMRQASGTLPFQQIAHEKVLWLLAQLRSAYPLASVKILNTSSDGSRMAIRVSSQNRPPAFFIFDTNESKLTKLIEGHPDWANRTITPGVFISYQSPWERGQTGVASFIPSQSQDPQADTIINVLYEPLYDFDWGFSSPRRFLSAEGFNTLQIMIPWKLQLALGRASTPEEIQAAFEQCNTFLTSVLETVQAQIPLQGDVYYNLRGSVAALYPSLPDIKQLRTKKVFIVNPRFHVGFPGDSLSRLNSLAIFPFKRFADPKTWRSLAGQSQPILKIPTEIIWRENDSQWDLEDGTKEQIESFKLYCQEKEIPFELDRWPEGQWRVFETWKLNAAITIDIMDKIRGTESGILEAWHQ